MKPSNSDSIESCIHNDYLSLPTILKDSVESYSSVLRYHKYRGCMIHLHYPINAAEVEDNVLNIIPNRQQLAVQQ